ncbi:hypothetical protein [Erwinia sp. S59]|uniref:hypothetical protein n=1 Tax=Erwinia sp. S59 TaxID=2769340 RepID=UPI002573948A|nr:hypothetical protein [Erwinia sp. S59]
MGTVLYGAFGFKSIALITLLLPLLVLFYLSRIPAVAPPPPPHGAHATFGSVMKAVWLPGLGAALASTGYCTILAFSSLYYSAMHWQPVWMAFTAFGMALIVARTFAGHLPDRFGGALIALIFVLVQAAGLFLMWFARIPLMASA